MKALLLLGLTLLALCCCQTSAFKVFGASPGRSGTDSQKMALTRLGFGPTMHMKELMAEESGIPTFHHLALYERAARGETIDWVDMLKDFNSGCDFPLSAFPEELLAAFPDARFVLNIRPATSWYRSLQQSICHMSPDRSWFVRILATPLPFFPFTLFRAQTQMMDAVTAHKFVRDGVSTWGDFCSMDQPKVEEIYHNWNAYVKSVIPPKQLLIFNVGKEGYKELAAFLDVEAPAEEYPNANSSAEFRALLFALRALAAAVVLLPVALVLLLAKWLQGKARKGRAPAKSD